MLIIPYSDDLNIDSLSDMVQFVNQTEVEPTDRLTDRAYILEV